MLIFAGFDRAVVGGLAFRLPAITEKYVLLNARWPRPAIDVIQQEAEEIPDKEVVVAISDSISAVRPLIHEDRGRDFETDGFQFDIAFALPCLKHFYEVGCLAVADGIDRLKPPVFGDRIGVPP